MSNKRKNHLGMIPYFEETEESIVKFVVAPLVILIGGIIPIAALFVGLVLALGVF